MQFIANSVVLTFSTTPYINHPAK